MSNSEIVKQELGGRTSFAKLPILAVVVALCGLADAVYLTIHHYTAVPVPCGEAFDCGAVLTSQYAVLFGVPVAIFGAIAYFTAFSLAILTAFGNARAWMLFGVQVVLMSLFTIWLLFVQKYRIEAFCQFCLISAALTFTLLIIFLFSRFWRVR